MDYPLLDIVCLCLFVISEDILFKKGVASLKGVLL